MYLTAMSAVSIHNLVSNINEMTSNLDPIKLTTIDTNWTLEDNLELLDTHCNGTRQSPIDISSLNATENVSLRLGLTAYDKPILGMLVNQFPTFQLVPMSLRWPRPSALISSSIARSFNPYADKHFALSHIQFHWSHEYLNDNSDKHHHRSSMHLMDGKDFPLEIHFVHLNTAYSNIEEALTKPDGLLVLAVMAVQSTHESYVFDKILEELSNITSYGKQAFIGEESTWRNLLPLDTSRFYRYQGSLIFPPCYESVDWIIFDDKLRLGQRQLKRLKRYRFVSTDLRSNKQVDWSTQRRPIQPSNQKLVEMSFTKHQPILTKKISTKPI